MKKTILNMVFLALVFAACSSPAPTATPAAVEPLPVQPHNAVDTQPPVDPTNAEQEAVASLSETLGLPPEQITVVSSEAVKWPNGCLGIQRIGVLCTKSKVDGFLLVLEANDTKYEYHTNNDGSTIVPVDAMQISNSAEAAVMQQLAVNLDMKPGDIKVKSDTPIEWTDSCLGDAIVGIVCAETVTPGYLIILKAGGNQYEYHTSDDGSQIVPGTLALNWSQQGGIAGVCDSLTVFASGEVYGYSCAPSAEVKMSTLKELLSREDLQQFYTWLDQAGTVTIDFSDPAGAADAMTRAATLYGRGNGEPSVDEEQAIYDWATKTYQVLYK